MNSYQIYVVDDEKRCSDLVLLDIGLPGMSGTEALQKIKKINPAIIVIMITAHEDVGTVISAMKIGAWDYVLKPIELDSLRKYDPQRS